MSSFLQEMNYASDNYFKWIKEEKARESMTPKKYGIMIQMKKKKGRCNR